jgi:hypothetical protein
MPLLLVLLVAGCSAPCPDRTVAPTNLCLQTDAGALLPNQPFVITAANYGIGLASPTCEVSIDGGAITLAMSGAECPSRSNNNPVVPVTEVRCTISALDAGSYTLNGRSLTATDDAGIQPCP